MNRKERMASLLKPGATLAQRAVRGGFWMFALGIVSRSLNLARTVILARLLAPEDFGLFGITILVMSGLQRFSESGFEAALIQKKGDTSAYLDTAWTVQLIRGLVIGLILFGIAPIVATFFDEPAAISLLRVVSFSMFFRGLTNIGVVYFQKELEFHKQFVYAFSSTFFDLIVALTAALLLRNVWALVFGLLAGSLAQFCMSYLVHPYRPRLAFNWLYFKELFGFGSWILSSNILIFFLTEGDDAFVGKLLGATALGFYQVAYRLSNMPATEIAKVISGVVFPVYSKLQDDSKRIGQIYFKVLQITSFLSFLVAGFIFVLAPYITVILLGEKWLPVVPAMQALSVFGVTRALNATISPFYRAIGKPQVVTFASIFQLILLVVIIYPLTNQWGILGTSLAVIVPNLLVMLYLGRSLAKAIGYDFLTLVSLLIPPTAGVVSMFIVALFFKTTFDSNISLMNLLFLIPLSTITYLAATILIDKLIGGRLVYELKKLLAEFGLTSLVARAVQ